MKEDILIICWFYKISAEKVFLETRYKSDQWAETVGLFLPRYKYLSGS